MIPIQLLWWNDHPDICHSPGMWDQWYLERYLLAGFLQTSKEFFRGGVIVVPGRFHNSAFDIGALKEFIQTTDRSLVIVTSDEEGSFPAEHLPLGRNRKLWVMTPSLQRKYPPKTRFIGSLVSPHGDAGEMIEDPTRQWIFIGQNTHEARNKLVEQLENRSGGLLITTGGFAEGLDPVRYMKRMAESWFAFCPPGPVSPDSFRFYEALEVGCIPVLSHKDSPYWRKLFGKPPPVSWCNDWDEAGKVINSVTPLMTANHVAAWWKRQKFWMGHRLESDIAKIGLGMGPKNPVTFLVSVSPIESHPDDSILQETIESIRDRSPDALIYLMFDGVRHEQKDYTDRYALHIRRVMVRYQDDELILPFIMHSHQHQAVMTRRVLRAVTTPLVGFVEHDTPLVGDIPLGLINLALLDNSYDLVRFHHEVMIQPGHEYLMIDHEKRLDPLYLRTVQWSQRPHIARVDFYRRILSEHFTRKSRTMIEDTMHSVVQTAWQERGIEGWENYRLAIYAPDGDIKRSTHLDGRGSDQKFAMRR